MSALRYKSGPCVRAGLLATLRQRWNVRRIASISSNRSSNRAPWIRTLKHSPNLRNGSATNPLTPSGGSTRRSPSQGADRAVASPLQHCPATQRPRIQAASAGDHPQPAHRSVLRYGGLQTDRRFHKAARSLTQRMVLVVGAGQDNGSITGPKTQTNRSVDERG